MMTCPSCGNKWTPRARSSPQHRRFFGMIASAFHQWPEQYEGFQPLDSEHLRAWLLCSVGYRHADAVGVDVTRLNPRELSLMKHAYEAPVRTNKDKKIYRFWRIHDGRAYVVEPLSTAFENMPHEEACKIMNQVDDLVCSILGLTNSNELLRNHPDNKSTEHNK